MSDFTNLNEVLNHREEVLALDLIADALLLDEEFQRKLCDPEPGLYIPGSLTPIFRGIELYYRGRDMVYDGRSKQDKHLAAAKPITNLTSLKTDFDDIYDRSMTIVVDKVKLRRIARFLTPTPVIPVMAIRLAVAAVVRKVTQFSRSRVSAPRCCEFGTLIKPEFFRDFIDDDAIEAFPFLMDKVMQFIKGDVWNIYTLELKGTMLIITKGIDWRIYSYYENRFKEEAEREKNERLESIDDDGE